MIPGPDPSLEPLLVHSLALAQRIDEHILHTGRNPIVLGIPEATWDMLQSYAPRGTRRKVWFRGIPVAPAADGWHPA